MKKILALLLVLVMCAGVFVGCKKNKETGVTLEQAKDYLYATYKDKNDKATPNDYDVLGKIIIDETPFDVTWTTDNANIVVKASSKANFWTIDVPSVNAAEVKYTLTATIKNEAGETIQVSFTPVLPVIDNTGVETDFQEGVAYTMFMKQMNLGYTVYALNTTKEGENKFIETTMDPKAAAAFYVEIVDGGYKIYTEIAGVKNYLHAELKDAGEGKVSKYIGFKADSTCVFTYEKELGVFKINLNGTWYGVGAYQAYETIALSEATYFKSETINIVDKDGQFPVGLMTKAYADTLAPSQKPTYNDPAANSTLTIAQAIEVGKSRNNNVYTENKYYVQGQVKEIQNDVYGNLVLTDGTNDILVYGTWSEDGNTRFDKLANKPAVGDTIKVYGIIGKYNNAAQMKNGWITGATASGSTTPTPTPPAGNYEVVEAPVAGTAYKFGMVQTAAGKTVYLKGGMDGFYMATTENAAEAIDVYLEATTGGYYFYTMSGTTKTYLNVVVEMGTDNKEHVNAVYGTTASTVYTLDATLKTLVVTITGTAEGAKDGAYAFGTRNDKTYTTVGAVQADATRSFICQFYALAEGGDNGGSTGGDNGGDTGGTTPPASSHTCEDTNGDYVCDATDCTNLVLPAEGTVLTIAEALKIGELYKNTTGASYTPNKYYVVGTITEITSAKYGTCKLTDGTNTISVYGLRGSDGTTLYEALATKPVVGDTVKIYGKLGAYYEGVQFDNSATVEHTPHTCAYGADDKCTACGTLNPDHVHAYTAGVCVCGALEPVAGEITASKTMAELITANGWGTTTTKQSFNLDDVVSVKINGGSNTGKAYNGDHLRIYATDTPAGTITITLAAGYELVSVKCTTQTGTYAALCVDGTETDISNETVSVSGSSVVLKSVKVGTDGKQVRLTAMEVVYRAVSA